MYLYLKYKFTYFYLVNVPIIQAYMYIMLLHASTFGSIKFNFETCLAVVKEAKILNWLFPGGKTRC